MKTSNKITAFILGFWLIILWLSVIIVTEGQRGIVLRLGRLVTDNNNQVRVLDPGLHIKIPFIETIRIFDTRLQTLDIKSSRIVTKEKKDVMVDYYIKWQINNLGQYFRSTGGNQSKADTLLEQQLNTYLRAAFGKRTIADVVSNKRDNVIAILGDKAKQQAAALGIKVVDVRIKGIELPANTSNAIYQRMEADMKKIANHHRADGQAEADAIQAGADAEVTVLLAKARSQADVIKAEGQAQAAKIYRNAFNQQEDFFIFYRSLKAYQASFRNQQTFLVLSPENSFFEYFNHALLDMPSASNKK